MIPTNAVDFNPETDPEVVRELTDQLEEATSKLLGVRHLAQTLLRSGNPARRAAGTDIMRLLEPWE